MPDRSLVPRAGSSPIAWALSLLVAVAYPPEALASTVEVTNAASFARGVVAPASIAVAFGSDLASGTASAPSDQEVPTVLAGTSLQIVEADGAGARHSAPLFFVSPGQVNFYVPSSVTPGRARVEVHRADRPGGPVATGSVQIEIVSPGLFSASSTGQGPASGYGLLVRPDGRQDDYPLARFDTSTRRFNAIPISLGSPPGDRLFLVLFGTGFRFRSQSASAALDGVPVSVAFAGVQPNFLGLDQVNLEVPRTFDRSRGGPLNLTVSFDGKNANTLQVSLMGASLRSVAAAKGVLIGAALEPDLLDRDPTYKRVAGREFNFLSPENAMKWGPIHPGRNQWNFGPADRLVEFAQAQGMRIHAHVLVWHEQLPDWVNDSLSTGELRTILHDHIRTVVRRYKGKIYAWDVVNEAVLPDGSLRDTIFRRKLGDGYIDEAFRIAREEDPGALLLYNEFDIEEGTNSKSAAVYRLMGQLLSRGVPIDGIGLQGHLGLFGFDPGKVRSYMERLALLKPGSTFKVTLSELDVDGEPRPGQPPNPQQAQTYRNMVGACMQVPACFGVTFWGLGDKYSWRAPTQPLPFDVNLDPKPAYFSVRDAIQNERP